MNRPESHSWASWVRSSTESSLARFRTFHCQDSFGSVRGTSHRCSQSLCCPPNPIGLKHAFWWDSWTSFSRHEQESFKGDSKFYSVINVGLTKVLRFARKDTQPIEFSLCHTLDNMLNKTRPCTSQWDTLSHTKDPGSKICCFCTRSRRQHPGQSLIEWNSHLN